MKTVKISDKSPNEILDIVNELRSKGYTQGVDFDFVYHPSISNYLNSEEDQPRYTMFNFYKEELATWFTLWQ